jgi:uncharacterized protein
MDRITVPFVVVQNPGHFNLHQFGAYDLFENSATPEDQKWLIIGPAEYDLPCMHWQLEALAFFDHILLDAKNGYEEQAAVRYFVSGPDDYRTATDFPIPGSEVVRLYPTSLDGPGLDERLSLITNPSKASGVGAWAAVPIGAPVTAGFDEVEHQVVSYDLTVDEDTEFVGPVTANLTFSSNEIDSYVIARLGRVDLEGNYEALSLGAISPARRRIDDSRSTATEIAIDIDHPQPLVPGEPVLLRFSLTPHPFVARKGEQLRIDVGSRTDRLLSNTSQGRAQFDMQVPPYFSRNKLHHGPDTYMEVRKVPAKLDTRALNVPPERTA